MTFINKMTRVTRLSLALFMFFVSVLSWFTFNTKVGAYTLPADRFIQLSSSENGADDVIYRAGFETNQGGASSNIGGMVVEFCSNSPIIGDSCTAPTGLNLHAFTGDNTLVLANQVGITDWQKNLTNATANRLVLSRTGGAQSETTALTVSIDLGDGTTGGGVTNPSTTNETFYARILTFDTQVGAEEYAPTDIDNSGANTVVDAGGVALSTAEQITITAKVQERLTFCVYTSALNTSDCTGVSGSAIALGDTNGVLSDAGEFVDDSAKYNVSTNASSGVVVRVQGTTLKTTPSCSDAPGQTCSIDAAGETAVARDPGNEQFGMCTYRETTSETGLTPSAPYDHTDCNAGVIVANSGTGTAGDGATAGLVTAQIAFDTDTVVDADQINSTFGNEIAQKTAGNLSSGILVFSGSIATTTEPGIYVTTLTFIATGTF